MNNKVINNLESYLKHNSIQEFIEYCNNNEVPEIYKLFHQSFLINDDDEKGKIYDKIIIACKEIQKKMGIDSKINNDFLYISTLNKQIDHTKNVETKINLYTQLARKYRFLIFSIGMEFREKAIKTYNILLKLAKISNNYKALIEAYGGLGRSIKLSKKEKDLLLSIDYFEKELHIAKTYFNIEMETERSSNLEICLRDLGKIVTDKKEKKEYLEKGLNISLKYLKIAEEKGMRGEYANKSNNIAEFYFLISLSDSIDKKIKLLDLSYKYYKQAYKYWLGVNWDGLGVSLLGMSEVLLEKSNYIKNKTFIFEGIELTENAISLYKKLGNKYNEGFGYLILSEFHQIDKNIDESKKYYELKEIIENTLRMKINVTR